MLLFWLVPFGRFAVWAEIDLPLPGHPSPATPKTSQLWDRDLHDILRVSSPLLQASGS
jgi:hypothetical protein